MNGPALPPLVDDAHRPAMITQPAEPLPSTKRRRNRVFLKGLVAGIVLLAPILGGTTQRWSQGLVFVLIGLLLIANPPRHSLPRGYLIALAGLFALILSGFLPASWFAMPQWRADLAAVGVELPSTLSAQPWVTFDSMLLFIGGAAWMSWLAAQNWNSAERRSLARIFSAGVALFALAALLFYFYKSAPPFWLAKKGFGPFPNRNQTSNFLALGGIMTLACAHSSWRHGKKGWPLWLVGFAVILFALIVNESRAGILLLFVGTGLYVGALCYFSRSLKGFTVGVSGVIFLVSIFLLFGGGTLARFKTQAAPENSDGRVLIFQDALQMISANPWNGAGLGNFQSVSPFFRQFWKAKSMPIHPESDWLWVAAELGWGAVILILIGAGILFSRAFPLDSSRRLRAAALIAVLAFACHGLMDVSGHRLGTMIPALFLFGLAMAPSEKRGAPPAFPMLFRFWGLLVLLIGSLWLGETWRAGLLPGKLAVVEAKKKALELKKAGQFNASIQTISKALPLAPLDWDLYFGRASARAFSGQWIAALGDFRRARRLQPNLLSAPIAEGKIWLELKPEFAVPVWKETLAKIEEVQRPDFFSLIAQLAPREPEFQNELKMMAAGQPLLELILLARAEPAQIPELIQSILGNDPRLKSFSKIQKAALLNAWARSGDAVLLEERLNADPAWMEAGWRILATQQAGQGRLQEACELAFSSLPPPPLPLHPAPLLTLQRQVFTNPLDFIALASLYQAHKKAGTAQEALPALEEAARDPKCPGSLFYYKAVLHAEKNDWRAAWSALEKGGLLSP